MFNLVNTFLSQQLTHQNSTKQNRRRSWNRTTTTTMSWLARSIANTLSLNDDDDEDDAVFNPNHNLSDGMSNPKPSSDEQKNNDKPSPSSPRGVKEDLSELTQTLSRQFWGVASFLAPPPQTEAYKRINQRDDRNPGQNLDPIESESVNISGIRSDFAEIGGRFKSGITKLSNNINVSEFTKIASNFMQLGSEEDKDLDVVKGAVGVTEQAVAFARDMATHPETWLDFPLPENQLEEDFDMSDAQQEHALAVEHHAPRLAALRIELCPGYMSESCFWTIYFVLLHPTLDEADAEILSTPQVMRARALLASELEKRTKARTDEESGEVIVDSKGSPSFQHEQSLSVPSVAPLEDGAQNISISGSATSAAVADSSINVSEKSPVPESAPSTVAADPETDKNPIISSEIQFVDKSMIEVEHINHNGDQNVHSGSSKTSEHKDEDDGDDWLKEEPSEIDGVSGDPIPINNDEDVSFSDLEEDDEDAPGSLKTANYTSDKDSREWVQL